VCVVFFPPDPPSRPKTKIKTKPHHSCAENSALLFKALKDPKISLQIKDYANVDERMWWMFIFFLCNQKKVSHLHFYTPNTLNPKPDTNYALLFKALKGPKISLQIKHYANVDERMWWMFIFFLCNQKKSFSFCILLS
jgi:hypothetical protein